MAGLDKCNGDMVMIPDHCDSPLCGQVLTEHNIKHRRVYKCDIYCCSNGCLDAFEKLLLSPKISERLQ